MKRLLISVALASLLAACSSLPNSSSQFSYTVPAQPEGSTGFSPKPGWATTKFAVAAANPLATDAGYQVLKAGGSAIDAAIAVQMVLALVEPQSSGIGGGAFLLHYNGKEAEAFDGRETAPAAADEKLFIGADGEPMPFHDAVIGGRSVGVPGVVRMLEMVHKQYGKLPWANLFEPAIMLAEGGFKVSARLSMQVKEDAHLQKDPTAGAYFYKPDGNAHEMGFNLRNPELAATLKKIAVEGSKGLHEGEVAQAIVDKVQKHPTNPGKLALSDLSSYQAKKRDPICSDYSANKQTYRICGMPPPSSGAIAVGQILGIMNNTPAATLGLVTGMGGVPGTQSPTPSADWLHLYTEASRLAFADRAQYLGDPDFVQPPGDGWMSLLDPGYLSRRAKLIQVTGPSMKTAKPGEPGPVKAAYAPMTEQPEYGTSHISIVDAHGNAVAMTTTVEDAFGSRQMVKGFLLNNELTDFSFAPVDADDKPVANRLQPGKRPRSSMAPTLVFDKNSGQLVMSAGSMGGASIIHSVAKTLYGVLNWGLLPQQAIDLPNFGSFNGPSILEEKRFAPATVDALKTRGAEVREQAVIIGTQAITRGQAHGMQMWLGGADPRREGLVMGD